MTSTRTATGRRLARSGVVLAVAMAVANAGNYALNVALARWLDPAAFGDLTLVVTLFLVLTAAAVAAQLLTAAQVARLDATGRWVESADLERWLGRRAWWTGMAAAVVLIGTAPALADLFRMASWVPLAVFGLGLPFYLAQAVYRGAAQGRLRFGRLSASFLLEVAVRLVLSVALVAAGAGVTGAAAGLSLSFVACWVHLRPRRAVTAAGAIISPTTRRAVFATAGPAMILLVGQIVVNNGDVLIVKSRFDAETAGTYAAVALVGRAVFFCTWAVVTTLFPAAARQDATGDPDPGLLRRAVAVTATVSAVLTVAAWTIGPRVLELAFGAEYAGVGHLLGPYALATSLFALVNLMASHDLSLGRRRGPVVLAAGGAVQAVLVLVAGTTPGLVVWAQVVAMTGLLLVTVAIRRPVGSAAEDDRPASAIRENVEMQLTPASGSVTTPASDGGGLDWSVAFDALPVPCSVLDDRALQVRSNPAYARLFGYDSVADMAGVDALALTHPDHRDETTDYLRALAEGEIDRHTVEKRYLRRDGSAFWGRLTATRYTTPDGALFFVGVIENIDDERRLADAGAAAERRTAKILQHVSDTVTVIDTDGQVAGMTGDAENVLGYPGAWWEGRSVMDLAHPDDADYAAELLAETLASSGTVRNAILRAHHADGHYEWLEVTAVNLVDDPDVGGLVVTTHNVTERVRAEADLAAARDDALKRSADRSEYVAAVSHELRSPLHTILGSAELLEQADLPAEARTWTGQILREAGRLRHVVDDVLDLARLEAGRMEIHHEVFSLRDLVDEVRQLFAPTAEAKSVELTTRVEPEVEDRRTGDAHRIHQVVTNLVGNALKFTDVGRVELEVQGTADRDHVAFAVRDTGPGIPDDLRPDLFEPFVQVSPAHGRTGSGLGLAISSRLIEAMEGTPIEVSSLVGQGSSFSFSLALPLDDGSGTRDLGAASPSHPPSVRILVVDDNETNRILLEAQLTRAGYAVELAAGGVAAVERAVAEPFDVILMDWRMPDVDGLAATRRIRARELVTGGHVPIIALTASALPGDRERCLAAGMDGFLAKPVDTEGITAAVARVLPGPGGFAAGPSAGRPAPADAVDRDRFDRLSGEIGPDALRSVLQTFLDDLTNRVEAIRLAVTTRDEPALRRAAHDLRSPAGLLGADELGESCRRIEQSEAPLEVADLHAIAAVAERSAAGLRSAAASLDP